MNVHLTSSARGGGGDGGAGVDARGGEGRLVVRGALSTPDPCHRLVATARRHAAVVALRVEAHRGPGACIASVGAFDYEALLEPLPPGRYTLRVTHAYPGSGWPAASPPELQVVVR